jgi:hypothetical protein
MSILEKDRPKTGRAAWGDARVPIVNGTDVYGTYDEQNGTVTPTSTENFSSRVRYDTDLTSLTEILNSSTGRSTINTSESTTVDNGIPY